MSSEFNLEQVDVDGAIREQAYEAGEALEKQEGGSTRADFFKKAGLAGGALMGGGVLLSTLLPSTALARGAKGRPPSVFGPGDIGVLNFALTLEYLERAYYNEATKNNRKKSFLNKGIETNFLKAVTRDERAHVKFLAGALGKAGIKEPKFNFGRVTYDRKKFLEVAFQLEDEGVGAYSGQALNIANPEYVQAAVSILTIEARHAGIAGELTRGANGIDPHTPFDRRLRADQVLKDVGKTGFIKKIKFPYS